MNRIVNRSMLAVFLAVLIGGPATVYAQESIVEKAGSKTRKFLGELKDGFVREGEKRGQVNIVMTERAKTAKLVINTARFSNIEEVLLNEGITVYAMSPVPFKGRMVARAIGKDNVEMGQSRQLVTLQANAGKNVVFDFPRSLDTKLVEKYEIDLFESAISIDLQPEIESKLGLTLTQIEEPSDKNPRTLTAYAISKKTVNARLIAKAFDATGQEVDRDQIILRMSPKDSQHLKFSFTRNQSATRYGIIYEDGTGVAIEPASSLQTLNLEVTRFKEVESADKKLKIISYVIANKKFSGRIIAKALDKNGVEIGRGTVSLNMKADDAQDVEFNFPASLSTEEVNKVVIEARKDEATKE